MIKQLFAASLVFAASISFGQRQPKIIDSEEQLKKAINFMDKENYEGSIKLLMEIPFGDPNFETAQYELCLAYSRSNELEKVIPIAENFIAQNTTQHLFYNILGSVLDDLGREDESIKVYEAALERFPYSETLWINKGIVHEGIEQIDEAVAAYKHVLSYNPFYPSAHLRLAELSKKLGYHTQALISYAAFLSFEPGSSRSFGALVSMETIADQTNEAIGTLNPSKTTFKSEFPDMDLFIQNKIPLNKKFKTPSKLDFSYQKSFYLILKELESLEKSNPNGFYTSFYLPFLKDIHSKQDYHILSLLFVASFNNDKVQAELAKNMKKIKALLPELIDSWKNLHDDFTLTNYNGEEITVNRFYNKDFTIKYSGKFINGENVGFTHFYNNAGNVDVIADFNQKGERINKWIWFHDSGDTSRVMNFVNGKAEGPYKTYLLNGNIGETGSLKNGELEGEKLVYFASGHLKSKENFKNGKNDGLSEHYHLNGKLSAKANFKDGELDGELTQYFRNGQLYVKMNYKNGKAEGLRQEYYHNGNLASEIEYVNDKIEGKYVKYHYNGKISEEGIAKDNSVSGPWKTYYFTGALLDDLVYDENGKRNGDGKTYTLTGDLYKKSNFSKGDLESVQYLKPNGEVIYDYKAGKKKQNLNYYDQHLILKASAEVQKNVLSGEKKYFRNGTIVSSTEQYVNDELQGYAITYFNNGEIDKKYHFKKGELSGPYIEYYHTKELYQEGNYNEGDRAGTWFTYFKNGNLSRQEYFNNSGSPMGVTFDYFMNGKPKRKLVYDEYGFLTTIVAYDTSGVAIDSVYNKMGNIDNLVLKNFSDEKYFSTTLLAGDYQGSTKWYYPNGNTLSEGDYLLDQANGEWKYYFPNGNLKAKGNFILGRKEGTWYHFTINGDTSSVESFLNGNIHGNTKSFNEFGQLHSVGTYINGDKTGTTTFYTQKGEVAIIKHFADGVITGYQYYLPNGELCDFIPLENASGNIKAYFKNGTVSVEQTYKNGLLENESKYYHENGTLASITNFELDIEQGERKAYHSNGQLMRSCYYLNGKKDGKETYYYPNGKIYTEENFEKGYLMGSAIYNLRNGKSLKLDYYQDDVFSIQ
jgi:antitoxin component YwqK of YwqJK toxin-antitoxin module/Tfp pilus assembly protein PilF